VRQNFFQATLNLVKKIPVGQVSTYKIMATALGRPLAARAVGRALNKNPELIATPCHRVIKSNGEVGGYKKGKLMKKSLLKQEGIEFFGERVKDLDQYLFKFNLKK
jgi:O-6-methylguanine DNA methyltransferase